MMFKGKHSRVYVVNGKAVKVFYPQFAYNFWKEVRYLTILQKKDFVPKLFDFKPEELKIKMEFIDGEFVKDFVKKHSVDEVLDVLEKSLDICFYLDRMRIQKEEMNHPDKHIIISDRVFFIDFERAYETANPSNVTQFLEYIRKIIGKKPEIDLIKDYKRNFSLKSYKRLKESLFNP